MLYNFDLFWKYLPLHSGYYNEEGWIYYVDRMKEVIKYKNNHVAPTEIEDILQKHESVQECLVFGKKEPRVQELISAVVIVKPGKKVSYQAYMAMPDSKYFLVFKIILVYFLK